MTEFKHRGLRWKSLSEHQIYSWVGVVEYHSGRGVHARINGATRPVVAEEPAKLERDDVIRGYMADGLYMVNAVQVEQ